MKRSIITHAGGAHADEVVSTALVLAADASVEEVRRVARVSETNLASDHTYVLDIGRRHEPERLNFDHHQFDPAAPPRCTLTLVLNHLGWYPAAQKYWPWLRMFEVGDVRGAPGVAQALPLLGLENVSDQIGSSIESAVLARMGDADVLRKDDALFQALRLIGEQLVGELRELPDAIAWLAMHTEVRRNVEGQAVVLIVSGLPPGRRSVARTAVSLFQKEQASEALVMVTEDERGGGYVLRDCSSAHRIDFRAWRDHPDIQFVHPSGFLVVTREKDPNLMEEILTQVL